MLLIDENIIQISNQKNTLFITLDLFIKLHFTQMLAYVKYVMQYTGLLLLTKTIAIRKTFK